MPNPSQNPSRFSDRETEEYYDAEDALYRSFRDAEGSLHWGVFDRQGPPEPDSGVRAGFLAAGSRLNDIMPENSGIDGDAHVLDLGRGNGNIATWLCRTTGARGAGIDLSGVRTDNAIEALGRAPDLAQRLAFHKASATDLPFEDGCFSHVRSQATIDCTKSANQPQTAKGAE